MVRYFEVYDNNGMRWVWNGKRVYMLSAEVEMFVNGEDISQNGYLASTPSQAIEYLIRGGYIAGIVEGVNEGGE